MANELSGQQKMLRTNLEISVFAAEMLINNSEAVDPDMLQNLVSYVSEVREYNRSLKDMCLPERYNYETAPRADDMLKCLEDFFANCDTSSQ